MKNHRITIPLIAVLCTAIIAPQVTAAQVPTTSEWSSRIWAAASDGNWSSVDTLLNQVPEGDDNLLVTFRDQLDSYRSHQDTQSQTTITARDEALAEMKKCFKEGKTLQAMQSAVKAQTLSRNVDDVMFNADVQSVLIQTQKYIETLIKDGNILTAQTLIFYLRTFYEGTSRNDKYERWDTKLEKINLQVSLLRQYAPEHLHRLIVKHAKLLGDDPPQEYSDQASDNWMERIDGIDPSIVIRSLDIAINEHMDEALTWESLITGGLESVKKLGENAVISETFEKVAHEEKQKIWNDAVEKELGSCVEYLRHTPGKRVLIQVLSRLLEVNEQAMELPDGVILREFGDGAMSQLDRYSTIIWPNESRHFEQQTEGRFVGVGIHIREGKSGEIVVTSPIEGSPAYYGGILPEDSIVAVDGESASGWSLNDAVDRITGPRGTAVTLTVRRGIDSQLDIMLTRDSIKLHSVKGWRKDSLDEEGQPKWDWFIDRDNRIGYIKLTGFSEETYSDILLAIREMKTEVPPNGLIVDLRYNPGGLLPTARRIANLFINSGTIVSGETAGGDELFKLKALPNRAYLADWPVVILINQSSASASEIVAGCVQAHDAGIIVGKRSWGKGSVQTVHQISRDANVKLTTQYYRLPSADGGTTPGRLVHKMPGASDWGVNPDVEVEMSPDQIEKSNILRREADMITIGSEADRPDINRLVSEGLDPQLETALLLLRANTLSRMISDQQHAKNILSRMIEEQRRATLD